MLLTLIPIVTLSFSPNVGTSTLRILEPLTVVAGSVLMTPAGSCTTTTFSFVCTVSVYAGDSGSVQVSIMNNSNTPIVATLTSNSTSPDVIVNNPAPTTFPPTVSTTVIFTFNVSQSTTPDTTTLHFIVTR